MHTTSVVFLTLDDVKRQLAAYIAVKMLNNPYATMQSIYMGNWKIPVVLANLSTDQLIGYYRSYGIGKLYLSEEVQTVIVKLETACYVVATGVPNKGDISDISLFPAIMQDQHSSFWMEDTKSWREFAHDFISV